ncbi:hypothetical protein FXO37_18494 [Capsicum annuum]|nr:hypothetical protein FXO37_18494 [Capsicum annuum]
MAAKCGGLPLSIVMVDGILAKMERTEESWKHVAMLLGFYIHRDSEAIGEQKGFVKSCEGKSLEDIADGYLTNLIARNLVMVSKRDPNAGPFRIYSDKQHVQPRLTFCEIDTLDVELMLTKTPNLLELKCHFTICNRQQLVFPEQLETLYISCRQLIHIPVCISASIKRLTLHHVGLDLEDLSHIGCELQSLQAFEMEQVIFQQLKWKVSDDEFPQLKVLKLQISFAFKEWTVSDDAFPKLNSWFM